MSTAPTYPGVYIAEVPSGVRTIVGVATAITAFIGRALRGPVNDPVRVQSFADFERRFGGLWVESTMSYAVQHYFLNGGTDAIIVRLVNGGAKASFSLAPESGANNLVLEAGSEGTWGNNLRVSVDHKTRTLQAGEADKVFNLVVTEIDPATNLPRAGETFRNVSIDANAPRYVGKVLAQESAFLRVPDPHPAPVPAVRPAAIDPVTPATPAVAGTDGAELIFTQYEGSQTLKIGMFALEKTDLFNLLCISPFTRTQDVASTTWEKALKHCKDRRAMLLVDPPAAWNEVSDVTNAGTGVDSLGLRDENAALHFPRLQMPDPLKENRLEEFVPCGVVAGIFARTDAQRGVWKAPAGQEATLTGVRALSVKLTDGENGQLNPLGVNCLRTFPVIGSVVWGARTLGGSISPFAVWPFSLKRAFIVAPSGSSSSPMTSRCGRRSASTSAPLCKTSSVKAPFKARRRARPTSSSATRKPRPRPTSTWASSISSSASRHSNQPSSSSSRSSRWLARSRRREGVMAQFSVNAQRFDPYKNFKFRVKWDGKYVAGVSKVGALKRTTEVVEHREGGDPSIGRKSPGRTKYEAITLERGVTHDKEFERWANKVWNFGSGLGAEVSLKDFRKNLIIEMYNEAGQLAIAYKVYRCWVSEYQAQPDLDANANAVAIQTIKLENEDWERDYDVPEPSEPTFTEPA